MTNTTYEPIPDNLDAPATKGDLQALGNQLSETMTNKAELKILREEINEGFAGLPTKEDFNQLLITVDRLVGQVKNLQRRAERRDV